METEATHLDFCRCSQLALEAFTLLRAGTLGNPRGKHGPFWPDFRGPKHIVVQPTQTVEWLPGSTDRNGNWIFRRKVTFSGQHRGTIRHLATVTLQGETCRHEDNTITDDHASWMVRTVDYLGLVPFGEGGWKEEWCGIDRPQMG